jgi:hypothetical protein
MSDDLDDASIGDTAIAVASAPSAAVNRNAAAPSAAVTNGSRRQQAGASRYSKVRLRPRIGTPKQEGLVSMTRGNIIKVPDSTPGIVVIVGQQRTFVLDGVWRSPVAPEPNMTVEVELDSTGVIQSIVVVDSQTLAKERVAQLSNAAQRQGKLAIAAAQQGFDVLSGKVGSVPPQRRKTIVRAAGLGGVALIAVVAAASLFGSAPSKRSFAKLINDELKENDVCWPNNAAKVKLPVHVNAWGFERDPILQGLIRGGHVSAKKQIVGFTSGYTISLTPKGESAKVWEPSKGFCLGHREVDEVVRWTEPTSNGQAIATQITYTWKIVDQPSWTNEKDFAGVKGIAAPVTASITAQKTNDGWQVVNLEKILGQALEQAFN